MSDYVPTAYDEALDTMLAAGISRGRADELLLAVCELAVANNKIERKMGIPEPTYTVTLTRSKLIAFLKDAQNSHFPQLDDSDSTVTIITDMQKWAKASRPQAKADTTGYSAEVRPFGVGVWEVTGTGTDALTVAHSLDRAMQEHGLYFSELHAHREDLVAGHVLTAEDGTEFRVMAPERRK